MSRDVLKISESATVEQLTSILTRHRITGLPVLDNKGKITGIVSEFDVIDRKGRIVADIMSREPITIASDAPVGEAAKLFVKWYGPSTKLQFDKRTFKIDSDKI